MAQKKGRVVVIREPILLEKEGTGSKVFDIAQGTKRCAAYLVTGARMGGTTVGAIADVTGIHFGSHDRMATVPCVCGVAFVARPGRSFRGIKKGRAVLMRGLTLP